MRRVILPLLIGLSLSVSGLRAEEPLPLVLESVDEIWVIETVDCNLQRVIFLRDDAILATRLLTDDMLWTTSGGRFQLSWEDYCWSSRANRAQRIVEAKKLRLLVLSDDPTLDGEKGLWWGMNRNMRDLKQP